MHCRSDVVVPWLDNEDVEMMARWADVAVRGLPRFASYSACARVGVSRGFAWCVFGTRAVIPLVVPVKEGAMVGGVVIQAQGGRIRQTAKPKPVIDIRARKYEDQMGALPVCTPTSYPELYHADVLIVARFHDCRVQSRVAHRGPEERGGQSRPPQSSVCRTSTRLVLPRPRTGIVCLPI